MNGGETTVSPPSTTIVWFEEGADGSAVTVSVDVPELPPITVVEENAAATGDKDAYIRFDHVYKAFGEKVVLDDVSFDVKPGETVCILGRSGVGKSVSLQSIMGFSPSKMGWIIIASSVMIVLVAPFAGWLSDRLGSRPLCTVGSSLIVIAQFFLASLSLDSSIPRIVILPAPRRVGVDIRA